jgi:hypothetical protein
MPAATGFTLITASNIYGSLLGQKLATGQIQFTAISTTTGSPISFEVGGSGQMVNKPYSFPIVNGAIVADPSGIAPQLPDVSMTNPVNIGYAVSIIDPLTGANILGPGYIIQPTGATFDFDTYHPSLGMMVTIQTGPAGATGAPGQSAYQLAVAAGYSGTEAAWLASLNGSATAVSALAGAIVPSFVGRNLFDHTKISAGMGVNAADGSVGPGQPTNATGYIYCPGATSMICNMPTNAYDWGGGICLYDANGAYMSTLPNSAFSPSVSDGNTANLAFTLPGTQTYVRFGYVPSWMNPSNFDQVYGMVYTRVTGTATLPGAYSPSGLDTVADVNAKDAVVAANAASALAAAEIALAGSAALALKSTMAVPFTGSVNLFNQSNPLYAPNVTLHTDGSLTSNGGGTKIAMIYCPGATQFITNVPARGLANGFGVTLHDAAGNFIQDISTTLTYTSGNVFIAPNLVQSLPGTQIASKVGLLLPGDYLQVGYRLHRVLDIVNSDSSGNAVISVWPSLREVPAASAPIILNNPMGLFRLATNKRTWSTDATRLTRLSIPLMEYR